MFKIFENKYTENNGIIRPPEFNLVKRVYEYQLDNIIDYYSNSNKIVRNTHILVRLLNLFTPSLDYSLDDFLNIAYARSPYIAKHFKFTSEINYGDFFTDMFYKGTGLIIYNEEYFNPYQVINDWKNIQAVRVLKHPVSSLKFLLPDAIRYPTVEKGFSVVTVNVPLLLLQYRKYLEDQLLKPDGERGGAQSFIGRYVLPNMLYSHIDLCIYNRFNNNFYNIPNTNDEYTKHPFLIIDYSKRVDNVSEVLLKYITNKQLPYYSYLKLIPSIFTEDSQESLLIPKFIKTRRNWWALYLTRLDEMCFLIDLGKEQGIYRNRELLARAKVDIQRLYRENLYDNILPIDMRESVDHKLKKILNS